MIIAKSLRQRKFILFISILNIFFFTSVLKAQDQEKKAEGKISGRILDSVTAQPIEYATISLVLREGNKTVNGTVANSKGEFKLENISEGPYKLVIGFIGYATREKDNIIVDKQHLTVQVGDIKLPSREKILKETTIAAEKSLIENKIDKLIYNVDQDVSSQTGVAADVLKKVPQVSIDVDGNVELLGNPSVRFLINGKPSVLFGNNITDVLQSIPASQIQSIEIITSPGAKYDAQGTGGIINIILKKSTAEGINGSTSLSAGTRLENGSFNLNAHHKNIGASVFFSGNAQLPSTTLNSMDRSSQTAELLQNGTSVFSREGLQSGAGVDWDVTSKDNLSASVGFNYFGNSNSGINNRSSISKDSSGNVLTNTSDQLNTSSNFYSQSLEYGINYKRKFKKEEQLFEVSYLSSVGNNYSHYWQEQEYIAPSYIYAGSYGNNPGTNKETNISIDYTQPFAKDALIETGVKTTINQISSVSDIFLLSPQTNDYSYSTTQSLTLNYKSNVYAGYLSGKFSLFDWLDIKTGLRYECTEPHAYFSNSGNVSINSYGTYVPSGVLSHPFQKHQTVKLSYTHRIERPEYRDLNPFVNASDPKNLTTGNTNLRPELGDKIELGYNKSFEKGGNINATLFYRGNKDDIQSFTRYYSVYTVGDSTYTNVAVTTRENIGREDNYGLSIFSSLPITKKINLRTNIQCFQRYIINGALPGKNIQGFNYRINATATYNISETFILELFGNFNSPRVNAQGTMPAFTTYNFALRKQFFHKKASFAFTATNFLNEYVKQETKLTGTNFTLDNIRNLPYRSFGINFTYKFGKLKFKNEKEIEDKNLTTPPEN